MCQVYLRTDLYTERLQISVQKALISQIIESLFENL